MIDTITPEELRDGIRAAEDLLLALLKAALIQRAHIDAEIARLNLELMRAEQAQNAVLETDQVAP